MGHGYHGQGTPTCAYQLDREELNKDHRGVLQFARVMLVLAREKLVQRGLEIETDSQDGKIIKFVGYLVFVPPFFYAPPRAGSYARFTLLLFSPFGYRCLSGGSVFPASATAFPS